MTKLPEFVYLVTVEDEWPVSAIAGDHPTTPDRIEREVERRTTGQHRQARERARVWRVPVKDAVEMELLPRAEIKPSLREKP